MNILMVNLHSAHNAGDRVLMEVAMQQLRELFPGCTLTLAMNDPASYPDPAPDADVVESFFAWYKARQFSGSLTRLWRMALALAWIGLALLSVLLMRTTGRLLYPGLPSIPRRTLRAYYAADLVVSCPGNFLYSRGHAAGLPLLLPMFTIAFGWLADKPVQMMPQTIGPLRRGWERRLTRWLLARVRVILLRDATSVTLMREMGVPPTRYRLTPDLAFLFDGGPAAAGDALLASWGVDAGVTDDGPLLGVTLIDWGRQNSRFDGQRAYEDAMSVAIGAFVTAHRGRAVLFAQVCGPTAADDDRLPARRVQRRLCDAGLGDRVALVDAEIEPGALAAAYGRTDLFLGSRLHSNIFALNGRTPVVAIAYQPKTEGVMQMVGLGEWVIPIEDATAADLTLRLEDAWSRRVALRQQIAARVDAIRAEAAQAVGWMRADYDVYVGQDDKVTR